jgi:hypothetical protein
MTRDYSKPLNLEIVSERELPVVVDVGVVLAQDDDYRFYSKAPVTLHFKGAGAVTEKDELRLKSQYERIFNLMKDMVWRTLAEIAEATGSPEGSVMRQLNYMADPRFGGHEKDKVRPGPEGSGLWYYRIIPKGQKRPGPGRDPFHIYLKKYLREAKL